jgi:hypothetical protein
MVNPKGGIFVFVIKRALLVVVERYRGIRKKGINNFVVFEFAVFLSTTRLAY